MRLYSFFNSSTSYRVRIALALKGLKYETSAVNIRTGGHRSPEFLGAVNPSAGVPVLELDGVRISQSLAIIDYLDAVFPEPPLIPKRPLERARVLSFANLIACDIHPLNNPRVLRFLQDEFGISEEAKNAWYRHWIDEGLSAAERMLSGAQVYPYCFGETPSLADCCLIPQIANASRMKCPLESYPRIVRIFQSASAHPAFQSAAPERQPDWVS